jgi:hypothetical protein
MPPAQDVGGLDRDGIEAEIGEFGLFGRCEPSVQVGAGKEAEAAAVDMLNPVHKWTWGTVQVHVFAVRPAVFIYDLVRPLTVCVLYSPYQHGGSPSKPSLNREP